MSKILEEYVSNNIFNGTYIKDKKILCHDFFIHGLESRGCDINKFRQQLETCLYKDDIHGNLCIDYEKIIRTLD